MKYKLTIALVAALTSSAFAEFKAPLPEFKNQKQLAEWRAEKAAEATSQGYVAEEAAFYTGKPYLTSSECYGFKYRNYNPNVARWTSEDPSGFPDGANASVYAPLPTSEVDSLGLDSVSVSGTLGSSYSALEGSYGVEPMRMPGISAKSQVYWSVDSGRYGWVVQRVEFIETEIFNDSDGSRWTPLYPATPQVYWEAWRVDDNAIQGSGSDIFQTRNYLSSTHGSASIRGTAAFYDDSIFDIAESPYYWSPTMVGSAGGLNASFVEPLWWTGGGIEHTLKITWE